MNAIYFIRDRQFIVTIKYFVYIEKNKEVAKHKHETTERVDINETFFHGNILTMFNDDISNRHEMYEYEHVDRYVRIWHVKVLGLCLHI